MKVFQNLLRRNCRYYRTRPPDLFLNLDHRTRITCDIFESVNMLCVPDRVSQLRLNHVFNIVQGLAPAYLGDHFERNSNITRGGGLKYEFSGS